MGHLRDFFELDGKASRTGGESIAWLNRSARGAARCHSSACSIDLADAGLGTADPSIGDGCSCPWEADLSNPANALGTQHNPDGTTPCGEYPDPAPSKTTLITGQPITIEVDLVVPHGEGGDSFAFQLHQESAAISEARFTAGEFETVLNDNVVGFHAYDTQLPAGVVCESCVLRWRWEAYDFLSCADVRIVPPESLPALSPTGQVGLIAMLVSACIMHVRRSRRPGTTLVHGSHGRSSQSF